MEIIDDQKLTLEVDGEEKEFDVLFTFKSEDTVNLKGIYYLLMYMLIKALKYNNGTLPEVFNKLDLSETIVTDDIGFLVKIITQFKLSQGPPCLKLLKIAGFHTTLMK